MRTGREETVDGCTVTKHVGAFPGGLEIVHAADRASCSTLSCTEAPHSSGQDRCRGTVEDVPYDVGGSVALTLEDELLSGPVSHTFPKTPNFMFLGEPAENISRSVALELRIWGGLSGTLTHVRFEQDNDDGRTIAVCEYPAESPSVTIPSSVLQRFRDGAVSLEVDMLVRHESEDPDGYSVELVVENFVVPQKVSYTFTP